jgi:hypothetical protein
MSSRPEAVSYLKRLYLTIAIAFALAYWPHPNWLVRFLCLIVFAILCGWTEQTNEKLGRSAAQSRECGGTSGGIRDCDGSRGS